ncbi:MAG TPA: hydroxyacid dehydrogenase [Verrucomicrobiota bacterium]|nr:hydroxyacid dehydrogenase [Verrucomicrobiota bacterium]
MNNPSAIVALTDSEAAEFFPGPMWSELENLLPHYRRVRLPLADVAEWQKLWAESPAEILVSAWQTPPLNGPINPVDLKSLRYVCYLAGSVRRLIPRDLLANGLVVTNWGNSIASTVAECALMLTLMAMRRASYWAIAMHRERLWKSESSITQSLIGRRVGLHGFGVISQSLVPMLRPFSSQIQTYSPRVPDSELARLGVARAASLEALFSTSDVVVELAAATPENYHLVNESHLRMIPDGGVFVNVGRGSVVDESALVRVARDGKIQIALDVFEREPLPADSPLRGLPNVTLLPHLGGPTRDRRRDSGALALKNLKAFLQNKPQEAVVSLDVYDRST